MVNVNEPLPDGAVCRREIKFAHQTARPMMLNALMSRLAIPFVSIHSDLLRSALSMQL
jgi:hypothetical protein